MYFRIEIRRLILKVYYNFQTLKESKVFSYIVSKIVKILLPEPNTTIINSKRRKDYLLNFNFVSILSVKENNFQV